MLSPGAHIDLLEEAPTHAWHTNTIHGFPFRVDPELADPANDAKSVVAGDFRSAYVVRLLPVRIETDADSASANDNVRVRIVLRADGTRQVTDACRALVHPAA
jgi:HK97 family phage major capsid protein